MERVPEWGKERDDSGEKREMTEWNRPVTGIN
jgi:hypothetical protein